MNKENEWINARNELLATVKDLGFPNELGEEIARNLGGTKAMNRMTSYLQLVKPRSAELVVDEMLAIKSEIDAWRLRKESLEANARYNEMLESGLSGEEEDDDNI